MKKFILLVILSLSWCTAFAQEQAKTITQDNNQILNEEIRKLRKENEKLSSDIDAIDTTQVGFGAWVDKTADYGAQQATTDGFVLCNVTHDGNNVSIAGYTDGNSAPTTIRQNIVTPVGTVGFAMAFCMPVKKNDYWKVVLTVGIISSVYWIPLGD